MKIPIPDALEDDYKIILKLSPNLDKGIQCILSELLSIRFANFASAFASFLLFLGLKVQGFCEIT